MSPETPTGLLTMSLPSPPTPVLGPGEVIKNSGKFTKPTRIPGKNYCKDEVVIRNSDSGKGKQKIFKFQNNFQTFIKILLLLFVLT